MASLHLVPLRTQYLQDAWQDFILSRKAMMVSPQTIRTYCQTVGKFVAGLDVDRPEQVTARHVRQWLAQLSDRGRSPAYIHCHARGIKTLLTFWHAEGYLPDPIRFDMPRLPDKRQPILSVDDIRAVLRACPGLRDRAAILLLLDSGLRRGEACALRWDDIDLATGLATVRRGKGGHSRMAVVGIQTRRALIKWRRHSTGSLLLGLTPCGLRSALLRVGERAGLHLTAHTLRRTFATLSLQGGMSLLHLQALLGHSSLEMVRRYAQLATTDLQQAHEQASPVDRLKGA